MPQSSPPSSGSPPSSSKISTRSLPQTKSASYRLPVEDPDFMHRDEVRGIRLQLEYEKPEILLREWGVRSTIIVFGSARTPSPERARAIRKAAGGKLEAKAEAQLQKHLAYYQAAREFGRIASERGGAFAPVDRWRDNVIATGGGPGVMEAANRGAHDVGAPTIGFNINLPAEQFPNPYTTPELTFRFQFFGMRKMHMAMRTNALVVFPGGFGTLDELFELVTLQQTGKAPLSPIVLYDEAYWRKLINFDLLVEEGMIKAEDLKLMTFAESAEDAWSALVERGLRDHAPPQHHR
jgi:uncharacterized protein (TIGR00730 family)